MVIGMFADEQHDKILEINEQKNAVLFTFYSISMLMLISFFVMFWFKKQDYMRLIIFFIKKKEERNQNMK